MEVSVTGGRLKHFLSAWSQITEDRFVLNCIKGYKIKLFKQIIQVKISRSASFPPDETERYKLAIQKLLETGALKKCTPTEDQFISPFFLRSKKYGSDRFTLNLKGLKKFIKMPHFKLENIRTASMLLTPGMLMANLDLKDAYFLVPIHKASRKYLRFVFLNEYYEFAYLPFSLCISPFIFTSHETRDKIKK